VLTRPPCGDELVLTELYEGETFDAVQAEIGWPLQAKLEPQTMEGAA
jgi:acyl CoA:acetate/3-ketoacid CoA transferase beta subunit